MSSIHPLVTENSVIAVIYEASPDTPYHGGPGPHYRAGLITPAPPTPHLGPDDAHSLTNTSGLAFEIYRQTCHFSPVYTSSKPYGTTKKLLYRYRTFKTGCTKAKLV